MVYRHRFQFGRDTLVATAVLVGLYALGAVGQATPLVIPRYFLVVGFDALEAVFGAASAYRASFALYLLGLGLVAATAAAGVRRLGGEATVSGPRLGAAGGLAVVGVLSLAFAASVFLGTAQREPVRIAAAAGLIMLALAGWLGGLFTVSVGRPRR